MVNFPEVSMWGRSPWGGWGANPLPTRFEVLWKQTEGKVFGGMPYVRLRGFFPLFLEPGYFRFGSLSYSARIGMHRMFWAMASTMSC